MSKCGAPSPAGNESGEASRAVGVRAGKPIRTFVITEYGGQLLTALFEDRHIRLLIPEEPEESRVGNIYIGKVLNVVKNLGAAFIEFEPGKNGYFALEKNGMTKLATGTMLPVQVEKDAVKTKFPVLTRYLAFPGRYAVLTPGKPGIGISHRVKDEKTRERLKNALAGFLGEDEGVILRTSAKDAVPELLLDEIQRLRGTAERVARAAKTRTCYSLLYGADPGYLRAVRDAGGNFDRVVTDLPECREKLLQYFHGEEPEHEASLSFYDDPLQPLAKAWPLDKAVREALAKKVWLKSGGNLIIEATEALTVIDVNSAKAAGPGKSRQAVLRLNLEAADMAARQMILRNLSGMILIDFVNMEDEADVDILLRHLRDVLSMDPVRTVLVDMTGLGLVEITRQKVRRPVAEVLRPAGAEP